MLQDSRQECLRGYNEVLGLLTAFETFHAHLTGQACLSQVLDPNASAHGDGSTPRGTLQPVRRALAYRNDVSHSFVTPNKVLLRWDGMVSFTDAHIRAAHTSMREPN